VKDSLEASDLISLGSYEVYEGLSQFIPGNSKGSNQSI